MDPNDNILIFIIGMIGVLACLIIAPIINDILGVEFGKEIILFLTIFIGGSLYQKRRTTKQSDE